MSEPKMSSEVTNPIRVSWELAVEKLMSSRFSIVGAQDPSRLLRHRGETPTDDAPNPLGDVRRRRNRSAGGEMNLKGTFCKGVARTATSAAATTAAAVDSECGTLNGKARDHFDAVYEAGNETYGVLRAAVVDDDTAVKATRRRLG